MNLVVDERVRDDLTDSLVYLVDKSYYNAYDRKKKLSEKSLSKKSGIGIIPLLGGNSQIWDSSVAVKNYFNKGILRKLETCELAYLLLLDSSIDTTNVFMFNRWDYSLLKEGMF